MSDQSSTVQKSCIFTATASGRKLPDKAYTMPDEETRLLCARLILEEALETINALGFNVFPKEQHWSHQCEPDYELLPHDGLPCKPEEVECVMCSIIDGCVDTIYVATYCMTLMGVPDIPHIEEVCKANDAKFPNGVGVPHPSVKGKYGKPAGWVPPNHARYFPEES